MFYELYFFSCKIIPAVCTGKQQYTNDCDNNVYIKVSAIRISDTKSKLLYQSLRKVIVQIFSKQKNVIFPISNKSSLSSFIFSDNDINFKDFIKLIIKNQDCKGKCN